MSDPPPLSERARKLRVAVGIGSAVSIAAAAYLAAWSWYCANSEPIPQIYTIRDLKQIRDAIDAYRQAHGKLPAKLAELPVSKKCRFGVDEQGQPKDFWGHPIVYRVEGDSYVLLSYGQDGKPGGTDFDEDLTADSFPRRTSLWEFATGQDPGGGLLTCILTGLLVVPLCWVLSTRQPGTYLVVILGELAVIAFFALFMASIMIAFYFSGH